MNLMNKNPEHVAIKKEEYDLREKHGCSVCKGRNTKTVWGKTLCSDPTRQPGKRGFCPLWRLDE